MRWKLAIIALLLVGFSNCKRDPKPKGALSEKQFIEVLVDIHIAEGIFNSRTYVPNGKDLTTNDLYQAVLKKHGITNDEFILTDTYYSRNPKKFDHVYDKVLSKLKELNRKPEVEELPKEI